MGFLDRFKRNNENEITPENHKGKIVHSHYDKDGMVEKREVYHARKHIPAHIKARLNHKISPETRAKIKKAGKTAQKVMREINENAGYNQMGGDPYGLNDIFGSNESSYYPSEPRQPRARTRRGQPGGNTAYSGYNLLEGSSVLNHEGLGIADISEKRRQKERAYGDNLLGGFPSYGANLERGKRRKGRSSDLDWMY